MKKIVFRKDEAPRAGKLYLELNYMGGDADSFELAEIKLDFGYAEWKDHLPEIEELLDKYRLLSKITDINASEYSESHDDVVMDHGQEIGDLYSCVPGDPQTDGDTNCMLYEMFLVGYDEKGAKYKTDDLIAD